MRFGFFNLVWYVSLFVVYVATSCFGLYLIKSAASWKTVPFFSGFALYAAGAAIWMVILRLLPLSFAFPVAAGALIIGTMLTGVLFLNESIPPWHIVGALLIMVGIVLIATNR